MGNAMKNLEDTNHRRDTIEKENTLFVDDRRRRTRRRRRKKYMTPAMIDKCICASFTKQFDYEDDWRHLPT
jgi:hypothetical protein